MNEDFSCGLLKEKIINE